MLTVTDSFAIIYLFVVCLLLFTDMIFVSDAFEIDVIAAYTVVVVFITAGLTLLLRYTTLRFLALGGGSSSLNFGKKIGWRPIRSFLTPVRVLRLLDGNLLTGLQL